MPTDEPPSGLVVRPVTPADSMEQLTELLHRAYAGLSRRGLRYLATHQDQATTRRRIEGGDGLVATLDGRLVGTVTFVPRERSGSCEWYDRPEVARCEQLGVEPDLQGQRVGSFLMDLVEERARRTGAGEMALDTSEQAADLVAWYRRRGYRIVQEADWAVTNYRSVVLSKRLTPPSVRMRAVRAGDQGGLATMLVESVNWEPARPRLSRPEVLARPPLHRYVEGWGRPGDLGILAEDETGTPLGAAWCRCFTAAEPGFGFVAADVPEVSVAVRRPWRGFGLGDGLLAELEKAAGESGVRAMSLSVEEANPARNLYRRRGYRQIATAGASWTMRLDLGATTPRPTPA